MIASQARDRMWFALAAVALLAATLLTAGLAVAEGPGAQTMEIDVDIRHGETMSLDNGALHLTFVGVEEDSRCPRDVDCVWEGRAVVTMHVVTNGQDQGDVTLTVAPQPPTENAPIATVGAYDLRLDNLAPYPTTTQPTPPEQYVATVHVTRRQPAPI